MDGHLAIFAKELVSGGFYHPNFLPVVDAPYDKDPLASSSSEFLTMREIAAWIDKGSSLFIKAIEIGDLRSAQFLFEKSEFIAHAARNADGKTALHVACIKGYKNIVLWLLEDVKVFLEQEDRGGFKAIHDAVKR